MNFIKFYRRTHVFYNKSSFPLWDDICFSKTKIKSKSKLTEVLKNVCENNRQKVHRQHKAAGTVSPCQPGPTGLFLASPDTPCAARAEMMRSGLRRPGPGWMCDDAGPSSDTLRAEYEISPRQPEAAFLSSSQKWWAHVAMRGGHYAFQATPPGFAASQSSGGCANPPANTPFASLCPGPGLPGPTPLRTMDNQRVCVVCSL